MDDNQQTQEELLIDLANLRQQVAQLETVITKQKHDIQILRESEERYQLLFNNNSMGIIYFDTHGRYIMLNDYIAKQLGGKPEDFIGKTLHEVIPDVADFHLERFSKVMQERKGVMFEDHFILPTGTHWYSSYLQPVIDHTNKIIGIQIISIDITEQKRMEEELRYHSTLIEMISDAIISTDMNFVVQSWNPAAEALYGWTAEEVTGKKMSEFIGSEYPNGNREEILSTFTTYGYYNGEVIHHHKDGTAIYLWSSVTMLYDDKNVPIGAVSVNRNITERKQTENALRKSQENMAEAQRIAHIGSWHLNILTKGIYWSDEMYRIYGIAKNTTSETYLIRNLIHPDDLELFDTAFSNTFAGDVAEYAEYRIIRPDGKLRFIRATAQVFYDKSGQAIEIVGTAQDITERKELDLLALENKHLKAQFHKEQEQNEQIQRIISTLSHDMRTPLTLITLARDMLKLYFDKHDEQRRNELLDTIFHQTQFASQLLEDTVQVARGQHKFNPKPVNLATLCQISIDEIHLSEKSDHELSFNNLGKVETVVIDETLVSRILLNLLSNAIKYSPNGGEIRLELNSDKNRIILCVTDQGIGIRRDELPLIFDLLYRADNVDDIQGTGLGLSIVKDCVERHRGEITVESEVNKGSKFIVQLPV